MAKAEGCQLPDDWIRFVAAPLPLFYLNFDKRHGKYETKLEKGRGLARLSVHTNQVRDK